MPVEMILHPDTKRLLDVLLSVPLGADISFETMSAAIGRNVQYDARSLLTSARRIAVRDHGVAYMSVHGVGLRRLRPDQAPDIGAHARKKIRRTSGRARQDMCAVVEASNGLSPEATRRLNAEIATHGLLSMLATDRSVSRVVSDTPLSVADTARAFMHSMGATQV